MKIEIKQIQNKQIQWLADDDYKKAVFQLRGQLIKLMTPLEKYGQKAYVDEAIEQVIKLTEDFGLRVRGIDKEFVVRHGREFDT